MITRLPAVPLIVHDPMFSVWMTSDDPAGEETTHWTGIKKRIRGILRVDGEAYRFLGRPTARSMRLRSSRVTPTSTFYSFDQGSVRLDIRFTSPLLLDDPDLLSTPITLITSDVFSTDGRNHRISVEYQVFADLCHQGEYEPEIREEFFSRGGLNIGRMGQTRQNVLNGSGDQVTADWGHVFLASPDTVDEAPERLDHMLRYKKEAEGTLHSLVLIGFDESASIRYFGRELPSYYRRNGMTITDALAREYEKAQEILSRCDSFDLSLTDEAQKKGGKDYVLLVSAAYRQTVGAHKLVADDDGRMLFISKENDSNGCAATLDVSYPSAPLFLMYNPELVRSMLRPILDFARFPVWAFDFAPHDVGRYPILNGQVYGGRFRKKNQGAGVVYPPVYLYPDTSDIYELERQMPLEESANMILLLAAAGQADGDYRLAEEHLDLLTEWCGYLLRYGDRPGDQLCTDDFTGHLSGNVNLAVKAVSGIAAFARILYALGKNDKASVCEAEALKMAADLMAGPLGTIPTPLTFSGAGWSLKYNLVWDKLLGLGLFPESFYSREISGYLLHKNRYGIPLDSRSDEAKSDWILWTAAMAAPDEFSSFIAPVARYLRESESRVPFSDYYDSRTGRYEKFIARSVQGGIFMPLLADRWKQ
ncbi:MAG: DUF4965 domain-containing protein [Clostridia bacterium]|nr:DUF4965 domain-containing protein [Clostridia bacterium]